MSRCAKSGCKLTTWRQRLCYRHWRESQGFVFDRDRKIFVKSDSTLTEAR